MSFEPVISAKNLGKCYQLYANPQDRLKQFLWRGKRRYFREFWAIRDVSFDIMPGEVVGIVGRNGSGKSTLLQLVCGTLTPTTGEVSVRGRVAALLELGAGFNPEFTGRENVFMSAAIMGLSQEEIAARFEGIVGFSGIRDFIDQPVKTYSSGMYVRLAFSVAISVDPDILIIDEALSVGDGEFARKSFDRIMALKNAGKTILFCTHSMYQMEAICNRCIWLDNGRISLVGASDEVALAYGASLDAGENSPSTTQADIAAPPIQNGTARIVSAEAYVDGVASKTLQAQSMKSEVSVRVRFASDPTLPVPSVGVGISTLDGRVVTGTGTYQDGLCLQRNLDGSGTVEVTFPSIPLLRGDYSLSVVLACENSIHCYGAILFVATLKVTQSGLEPGVVMLPHRWSQLPD